MPTKFRPFILFNTNREPVVAASNSLPTKRNESSSAPYRIEGIVAVLVNFPSLKYTLPV